jgi:flagellar hook-length control protein FliK
MDATLMFSASAQPQVTPITSPAAAPSGASSPVGVSDQPQSDTPNGRIFAGLMRGLLPTHERQDVAASAASDPTDLKSEILGAQLEVITASSGQPDATSLSAFARAQGLDEAAVLALFGEKSSSLLIPSLASVAVTAISKAMTSEVVPTPENQAKDIAWLANALSAEITLNVSSPGKETSPPETDTLETSTLTTADWLAAQVAFMVPLPGSGTVQTSQQAIQIPVVGTLTHVSFTPPTETLTPLPAQTTGAQSLGALGSLGGTPLAAVALNLQTANALTPSTQAPAVPTPSSPASSVAPALALTAPLLPPDTAASLAKTTAAITAVGMLPPAAPTVQDTMRIRLVPAWANVTQKLTQMSGTALTAAWGALTAATLGGPIRSVALDLRNSEALEAEATTLSLDTPTPNSLTGAAPELNRNNTAGGQLPTPAQPLPGMNQMLRQEHYQQLADRLGQAMAERLQSQIARGEWKLQMRLNPASLGRIDIELDMHANGLDAMFRSDNALTRELMAQSMPKLKDTLTQSGMAVASVWVNSDAGRQSDGNPTPEKEPTPPTDNVASAPADNAQKAVTREKRTPDGFDVLA